MTRKLWVVGLALVGGIAALGADARAATAVNACPEIAPTFCTTIDLSEICGPGCTVTLEGYN